MNPVTHLLVSWTTADLAKLQPRDRALVTWCGVTPDLDALGLALELGYAALDRGGTKFYHTYHHFLTHGLPAAVLLPALFCLFGKQKLRVFLIGVLVFHLHLLCDLAGSRGPSPTDLWPIYFLAPLSRHPMFVWTDQWRLDGWQNFLITVSLMGFVGWRAVTQGCSPLSLISRRADQAVVGVLRRWTRRTGRG
ncbi:MAG: metal-dependent hydrolase [Verrucomicrobia bacterium]|nr:metal-dependent hydrolase [Verrucomicrobiota bacterium]